MAEAVYILCALTSAACAALLARGYARSKVRLLLWSSLCFAALAVNNGLVFLDNVLMPNHDLSLARAVAACVGLALLLHGLVWDTE